MMPDTYKYIDFKELHEMLYGEPKYIAEFAEAAISSFEEYKIHYEKYLLVRDEVNFRKAGHKIKPVAMMLHVQDLIDEYEHAKKLIWENKDETSLKNSVDKTSEIINGVLEELKNVYQAQMS